MSIILLAALSASAQEPLPIDIQQLLASQGVQMGGPKAEIRWMSAEAVSTRFPGDPAPGPTFAKGEMVEVVLADGATTRIRKGDRYGWVATSSLTMEQPAGALPGGLPPLLPPGSVPASP